MYDEKQREREKESVFILERNIIELKEAHNLVYVLLYKN